MTRTSDNTTRIRVVHGFCAFAAVLSMAGCTLYSDRTYPVTAAEPMTPGTTPVYVYPPVAQVVTIDAWPDLIARYRGQLLVLCLWRTADPNAVAGLHQAPEVLAKHAGGHLLGVNLDSPDVWLSAAVPMLRQAQARFPVVTIPDSQRAALLAGLGLSSTPGTLTYVVLSAEGKPIATRAAFEPVERVLTEEATESGKSASSEVVADASRRQIVRQDALGSAPSDQTRTSAAAPAVVIGVKAAASQADRPAEAGTLFYSLKVVRLADSGVAGEFRGVGQVRDLQDQVVQAKEDAGRTAAWLTMVGLQVAGRVPRGERVAVAPIRCSTAGMKATAVAFSNSVAEAIKASGRGVVGPARVDRVLQDLGISQDLLEMKPSAIRPGLDAAYLVVGTFSVSQGGSRPN